MTIQDKAKEFNKMPEPIDLPPFKDSEHSELLNEKLGQERQEDLSR